MAAETKRERDMILEELFKRVRKFNVKCNKKNCNVVKTRLNF